MGDNDQNIASTPQNQLTLHFIKAAYFRVIHASGAWFGGDAQQNIHLTFYSERTPIPKKIVVNLNPQGFIASEDESQREAKEGVIREMEADVVLSLSEAIQFHKYLGENLRVMQEAQNKTATGIK